MEGRLLVSQRGSWIRFNRESHRDKAVAWLSPMAFVVLWQVRAIAADEGDVDPDNPDDARVAARHLDPEEIALELGRSDDYHPDRVREALADLEAAGLITTADDTARVRNVVRYNARRFQARERESARRGRAGAGVASQKKPPPSGEGTTAPKPTSSASACAPTGPVASRARRTGAGAGQAQLRLSPSGPDDPTPAGGDGPSEAARALADLMADVVHTRARSPNGVRGVRAKLGAWAEEFDRMLRNGALTDPTDSDAPVDKREIPAQEIRRVLLWLKLEAPTSATGFCWGNEIRSPATLRRKWTKVTSAMRTPASAPARPRESPLARRDVDDHGRGGAHGATSCPVLRFARSGQPPTRLGAAWTSWATERRRADPAWTPSTDPDLIAIVAGPSWSGGFTLGDLDRAVEELFAPEGS